MPEPRDDVQPVLIAKPPKKVSEMTEAELDAWADAVMQALIDAQR